jgi:hypothetical protein
MMMNWKKSIIYVFILTTLFITSCDWKPSDDKIFDYKLRGIWVSNDTSIYSGKLEITDDRITITGFTENQTPPLGDDSKRPFKNFTKGVTLKGYSEEGKIFIEDGGLLQEGISYTLYTNALEEEDLLRFTFGSRLEIMQRQETSVWW